MAVAFPLQWQHQVGRKPPEVPASADGPSVVVFWDGLGQGAMAFYPVANGQELSFRTSAGSIVDRETGRSTWTIEG